MNIPATKMVEGTGGRALAVWYDAPTDSFRYVVTMGEQLPSTWNDPRDGWEPFRLTPGKDCHAAAYMCMRDSDPYDHYHTMRKAMNEALARAVRERKRNAAA